MIVCITRFFFFLSNNVVFHHSSLFLTFMWRFPKRLDVWKKALHLDGWVICMLPLSHATYRVSPQQLQVGNVKRVSSRAAIMCYSRQKQWGYTCYLRDRSGIITGGGGGGDFEGTADLIKTQNISIKIWRKIDCIQYIEMSWYLGTLYIDKWWVFSTFDYHEALHFWLSLSEMFYNPDMQNIAICFSLHSVTVCV